MKDSSHARKSLLNYRIAGKFGEFTGYERLARKSLANA